jgi:cellulose biosynthesis protein BcsQ
LDKRILAICDLQGDYAYRMMEVLKARNDLHFDIHIFIGSSNLLAVFQTDKQIECLLITESAYQESNCVMEKIKESGIPHVFILNESGIAIAENHFYNINKYQSADSIINDVMAYYIDHSVKLPHKVTTGGKTAKIIGIYSPVKRCLQTTFSVTLGQILAKQHKTLYLNYESFSGWGQITRRKYRADITDMMYLFECVKEKFIFKLNTITEQLNGLDFIPPALIYPDLMNIPGKQWTALLHELREHSDYDYIILDLSEYVNGLLQILTECDWIYTITRGDFYATAKMEQYEQFLQEFDFAEVVSKTQKLNLPVFKNIPLKYDEMTYGELAAYIREKLLDDLGK